MKELVRTVNAFLNTATRTELDSVMNEVILSDRQKLVFDLVCIKKKGIYFAADTVGVCPNVVNLELRNIKAKIHRVLTERGDSSPPPPVI